MTDRKQYVPGPAGRGRGTKGRREVDAHSRPRTAPPAGEGLAGADRSGAAVASGRPSTPIGAWDGVEAGEAHDGGSADAARHRDHGDAGRRAQSCSSTTGAAATCGGSSKPLGGGTRLTLWPNIDRRFISMGAAGLAHLLRRAGSASRGTSRSDASSAPRP